MVCCYLLKMSTGLYRWRASDVRKLEAAAKTARDKRLYIRFQTLVLVARGSSVSTAARTFAVSRQSVHQWQQRYFLERSTTNLQEGARSGRPRSGAELTSQFILTVLAQDPRKFGYTANAWTVALVSTYLKEHHGINIRPPTLRRRFHCMGLRYKRPRYVYEDKEPNRAQKKGRSSVSSTQGLKGPLC